MNINKKGLTFIVDKRYELINGLFSAFIRIEQNKDYDWVESPDIPYVNALCKLINLEKRPKLYAYIKNGLVKDIGEISYVAFAFNDDFSLNEKVINDDYNLKNRFVYGDISDFACLIQDLVITINYHAFFDSYKQEFIKMIEDATNFENDICLEKIDNFYNLENKFNCFEVFTPLINGGFSYRKNNTIYSIHGLKKGDNGKYYYPGTYLVTMFHEFSHPRVNPLVDKYYNLFTNIEILLEDSIKHGLPNCYQKSRTMLYEYFVRANSLILAGNFKDAEGLIDWFEAIGFNHIREIIKETNKKRDSYHNYEDLFVKELIPLINNI